MEQKGSVGMSSPSKIAQACIDISELYGIYSTNWFDVEGNRMEIDSVTLQVVQEDLEEYNIFLTTDNGKYGRMIKVAMYTGRVRVRKIK